MLGHHLKFLIIFKELVHKHFLDGNTRVFFLDITIVQARSDTSNQQQDKWISSPTNTKLTVAARLHSEDQFFLLPLLSLS